MVRVAYEGVRFSIPADWEERAGLRETSAPRWYAPGGDDFTQGATLYGSALFDPAHGPGVVPGRDEGGKRVWSGYAQAGKYVVYVFDNPDRQLVADILTSVQAPR